MTEPIDIYRKGNDVLMVVRDDDPLNPRTCFGNVGHMACWHRKYDLGDKDHGIDLNPGNYGEEYEFMEAVGKEYPEIVVLIPLYLYDHGGITISTGTSAFRTIDSMGWDWGWIGFIYATKDDIRENFPIVDSRDPNKAIDDARKNLLDEVKTYNDYLTGRVYGYQRATLEFEPDLSRSKLIEVFNEYATSTDTFDACYGYYGDESLAYILAEHGFSDEDKV